MNDFACVIPILNVKNFAISLNYYTQKLGFRQKWAWGEPPIFGCVTRGKVQIFPCQGAQGQSGMWMSIFLDDVDALYAEYQNHRSPHPSPAHQRDNLAKTGITWSSAMSDLSLLICKLRWANCSK